MRADEKIDACRLGIFTPEKDDALFRKIATGDARSREQRRAFALMFDHAKVQTWTRRAPAIRKKLEAMR